MCVCMRVCILISVCVCVCNLNSVSTTHNSTLLYYSQYINNGIPLGIPIGTNNLHLSAIYFLSVILMYAFLQVD